MNTMTESATTATTIACEIARLPVDLISASIARTGPWDACRAAVVSLAFRTAADSDVVWNCFLPSNIPLPGRHCSCGSPMAQSSLPMASQY
jgi:hypothetical protein